MARWTACPYAGEYPFDTAGLRTLWDRLHRGDAEPLPRSEALLQGWALYHQGEFEQAMHAGQALGAAGGNLANKAAALYATHLETHEKTRLDLFLEVAHRAEQQAKAEPANFNAWYWHAYALGRYSQGVSVARALAQGIAGKVRHSLERVIELQPLHADAHVALGAYHAEVIDKVGALIGGMTYGAKREVGMRHFEEGLRLNPKSIIGMIECAQGLLMLEGDARMEQANRLWEQAAATQPMDAVERLNVERARLELQD